MKPELMYLNGTFKPMCEILPKDPINTIVPLIRVPKPIPHDSKYETTEITEKTTVPKRKIMAK